MKRIAAVLVGLVVLLSAVQSRAATFIGSFSGTISSLEHAGADTVDGVYLYDFLGQTITGSFVYDPAAFSSSSTSQYDLYEGGTLSINAQIGSETYSNSGSSYSAVWLWTAATVPQRSYETQSEDGINPVMKILVYDALYSNPTDLGLATFVAQPGDLFMTFGDPFAIWRIGLDSVSVSPVPVPAALPLFAGGLGAMAWWARRRNKQAA